MATKDPDQEPLDEQLDDPNVEIGSQPWHQQPEGNPWPGMDTPTPSEGIRPVEEDRPRRVVVEHPVSEDLNRD